MRCSTRSATGSSASGNAAVRAAVLGHGERLRRRLRGFLIVGGRPVACAAVAAFLSDEWVEELALACAGAPPRAVSDPERFVIEPVVTGVPDRGEVRYRIAFEAGQLRGRGSVGIRRGTPTCGWRPTT